MSSIKKKLYLVFVAVVIASYILVFLPYKRESERVSRELSRRAGEFEQFEKIESIRQQSKTQQDDFVKEIVDITKQEKLIPDVQQEVAKLVSAAGMNLEQVEALPDTQKGSIKISSFSIKAAGEYAQILKLLDEISLLSRLVNVQKFRLENFEAGSRENEKNILKLNLTLEYYGIMKPPQISK